MECIRRHETSCLKEDPLAFLCNLWRQLAQAWLHIGAPLVTCNLLELEARPLLKSYFRSSHFNLRNEAVNQSETNWRELSLFIEWNQGPIVGWSVRLSDDPANYAESFKEAQDHLMRAVRLSKIMPEGKQWTTSLLTALAEIALHHGFAISDRLQRFAFVLNAKSFLDQASKIRSQSEASSDSIQSHLILEIPLWELEYLQSTVNDTFHLMDQLLAKIRPIHANLSSIASEDENLLAARCAWLMGIIEFDLKAIDPSRAKNAVGLFLEALKRLDASTGISRMAERAIKKDIERRWTPRIL